MNRAISLLVLTMLSGICLFAGGGREEPAKESQKGAAVEQKKQIEIVYYRYANKTHNMYQEPIMEAFMKGNPDVKITSVEVVSGGYESLAQKTLLAFASGTYPDAAQVGYTYMPTMVGSGRAVALDKFMNSDTSFDKKSLFPAMMELGMLEGKSYMVPLGTSTPVMLINADLFKAVGLDPAKPPKTWAEARAAAVKLKDGGYQGILWGWSITGNWIFQTLLENCGGRMANKDNTQVEFDSEAGLRVAEHFADLASNGLMPVTDQLIQTFVAGKLGMLIDSTFQRVNTPGQAKFPVKFAAIPTRDGNDPIVPAGGNGIMMFAKDQEKQNAAWRFLKFVIGDEAGRLLVQTSGYTPANRETVEKLKKENAGDPDFIMTLDQVARVVPWHAWPGKNSNKIDQMLKEMQENILLGKKKPKDALNETAKNINLLLKE
jgi:multiple sugar transport system substrate-binding protein